MQLDLARCYAYGDGLNDRWLMEAVGRPAAVNPSRDLANMARTRWWPVLDWEGKENPNAEAQRTQGYRREERRRSAIA